MDRPTAPIASTEAGAPPASATPPPEPVQRWRITFARDPVPAESVGRASMDAWAAALAASGLAIAGLGAPPGADSGPRARFALAAPLAAPFAGRAELAEIWLLRRVAAWELREALEGRLPPWHRWVDAEDVWLGAPPLPGQVTAAEWTVTLAPPDLDAARLAAAARSVVAARSLPRVRAKAGGERAYDLRPLLAEVEVADAADGRAVLRVVTRFDPALGSGRPEEVVAAVAEAAGIAGGLALGSVVRERLILADPGRVTSPGRSVSPPRRPRR